MLLLRYQICRRYCVGKALPIRLARRCVKAFCGKVRRGRMPRLFAQPAVCEIGGNASMQQEAGKGGHAEMRTGLDLAEL